ncbi:hypothetical protein IGI04_014230 [Brassica rapa subsp. trilocularis]|uniref:Iron-related transcription factor 3 bHLH domain-containing protein n=1 Tax=Brassica rapa subsp. trilocularis TaxID=1813537 RepID=A0ABQ7MLM5_BRACM|nr:hypothetical protein IGI04_014230 [Brassica rapa subsp. trilocularis]
MMEVKKEPFSFRKVQKSDRENIDRDSSQPTVFELGTSVDPNRPKSDKGSILIDTIQTLKNLVVQVNRLKAEYVTHSQESRECSSSSTLVQSLLCLFHFIELEILHLYISYALIGGQNAEGKPVETEGMNVNRTRISQVEIEEHVIGGGEEREGLDAE